MEDQVLRRTFVPSTWAVWPPLAHSQTSWLLMWAYKRTPQVIQNIPNASSWNCNFFKLTTFTLRWGLLVDHSSSLKAKIRRWKGQSGWWPHPCERVLWKIPGESFFRPLLHGGTVLNLTSCPLLAAPVLRQRRSDGGRILHADAVEHESN